MTSTHQFDEYREQWTLARREAEAGSRVSAVVSLVMLMEMIERNAVTAGSPPPGFPEWLLEDMRKIFLPAIGNGTGLDKGFHLKAPWAQPHGKCHAGHGDQRTHGHL